jgi:hypothetical protein
MRLTRILLIGFVLLSVAEFSRAEPFQRVYTIKPVELIQTVYALYFEDSEVRYGGYRCEVYRENQKVGETVLYFDFIGENVPEIKINELYTVNAFNFKKDGLGLGKPNIDINTIRFLADPMSQGLKADKKERDLIKK